MKCWILILVFFLISIYFFIHKYINLDYLIMVNFLLLSLFLLISTNHYISFYLTLEMVSFCLYIIIGLENDNLFCIEAGLKYFVLNTIASVMILISLVLFFFYMIPLNFDFIEYNFFSLVNLTFNFSEMFNKYFLPQLLIYLALFFKLGLAPFHFWLGDTYEGSSLITMSLMALFVKSAYFFIFIRIFVLTPISKIKLFLIIIIFFGICSIIIGCFLAFRQKRVKRLIVNASIANMGYIILLLVFDLYGSVLYFLGYILISFYFFCIFIIKNKKIKLVEITDFKNLGINYFFIIVFFIFSAIPPSPLFFFKVLLLINLYETHQFFLIYIVMFCSIISMFYYLRLIQILISKPI